MKTYKLPKADQKDFDEEYWELTNDQLDELAKSELEDDRALAAHFGRSQDLDVLVHDQSAAVRFAVALQDRGQDLDILVHDPDENVRAAVARQGRDQDLDVLVSDKSVTVRFAVAEQGRDKDLDILVYDKNFVVRKAVAEQRRDKDLDRLVNDKDWYIRAAVAKVGREQDLDLLVSDPYPVVRKSVCQSRSSMLRPGTRLGNFGARFRRIRTKSSTSNSREIGGCIMNLEEAKTLEMLIKEDKKIFEKALKKVDKLAKKDPDDPKKWEFVRCHINDAYYDCVWKYDIIANLENDVNWYGFEEVCGWLEAIQDAGPDRITCEAIKDYHPKDWADCSIDEINDDSMEFLRPLW